jgi:hypothetical protein
MIVGFNHNITYKGVSFHVQTEDSGIQKPHLVTLLYHGGTIITSQKTIYADIIKVDNLEQVVEELAKEQHKGMLKKLTHGEFDERIVEFGIPLGGSVGQVQTPPIPAEEVPEVKDIEIPEPPTELEDIVEKASEPVSIVEEPIIDKFNQPRVSDEPTLDELIYTYLTAGQKH